MVDINDQRRELLTSVVTLAGAGLIKIIWDQQNQGRGFRVTHDSGSTQSGATSNFRINEDDFTIWELSFDRPSRIQYTFEVLDGPPIDVVLTDEPPPSQTGSSDWNYYPTSSHLDSRGATVVDELPPGSKYLIVFDNSNRFEANPPTNLLNDKAIVTFEFDISPLETPTPNSGEETPTPETNGTATPP